jgi:hypothetical protein
MAIGKTVDLSHVSDRMTCGTLATKMSNENPRRH